MMTAVTVAWPAARGAGAADGQGRPKRALIPTLDLIVSRSTPGSQQPRSGTASLRFRWQCPRRALRGPGAGNAKRRARSRCDAHRRNRDYSPNEPFPRADVCTLYWFMRRFFGGMRVLFACSGGHDHLRELTGLLRSISQRTDFNVRLSGADRFSARPKMPQHGR